MLKRKDWQLFHANDDGAQSSQEESSDSEEGSLATETLASSEEANEVEDGGDRDASDEDVADVRRLEDLSEDDFEPKDATDHEAVALKEQWLTASKEDAAKLPKAALACRLCKGVLMLGPASLRQHLESKRHLGRQKRKAEDFEPVYLAIDSQNKVDLETHQERLQRTKALLEEADKRKKSDKKRKKPASDAEGSAKKRKGTKPGKRQRAAQKQQANGKAQRIPKTDTENPEVPEKPAEKDSTGKRILWSLPKPKIAAKASNATSGAAVSKGKHIGAKKFKKQKKEETSPSSITANRAERRRIKKERLKAVQPKTTL